MLGLTIRQYTREISYTRVIAYRTAKAGVPYGTSGSDKLHGKAVQL
jgi:hypothetical protein